LIIKLFSFLQKKIRIAVA